MERGNMQRKILKKIIILLFGKILHEQRIRANTLGKLLQNFKWKGHDPSVLSYYRNLSPNVAKLGNSYICFSQFDFFCIIPHFLYKKLTAKVFPRLSQNTSNLLFSSILYYPAHQPFHNNRIFTFANLNLDCMNPEVKPIWKNREFIITVRRKCGGAAQSFSYEDYQSHMIE